MNNIEKLLIEEKKEMDNLEIPTNIESTLRSALDNIPDKKIKSIKGRVAALILAVLLLGYNMDTLAFYGKKLIGYENVMNGTLKELNQLGKGQIIDKSHTFSNGVKFTLDAIMLDDNNMIMFYTLYSPNGNVMDDDSNTHISITNTINKLFTSGGSGKANESNTEMKWVISTHEAPKFFEKTMKVNLSYTHENKDIEYGEIKFKIDRNQAVGKSLKILINKEFELEQRSIKVKSLIASPTTTIIKGQIQNIFELGFDHITKNRIMPNDIEIALIADGKEINLEGAGMSTDMKGTHFDTRFDAIPIDTKDLQLKLISFTGEHDVDENITLKKETSKDIKILNQDIRINNVYEKDGNTYITITTDENTLLSKVFLYMDGEKVGLSETTTDELEKHEDKVKINHTRTLRFEGTGEDLKLGIERIRYSKFYNEIIYSSK